MEELLPAHFQQRGLDARRVEHLVLKELSLASALLEANRSGTGLLSSAYPATLDGEAHHHPMWWFSFTDAFPRARRALLYGLEGLSAARGADAPFLGKASMYAGVLKIQQALTVVAWRIPIPDAALVSLEILDRPARLVSPQRSVSTRDLAPSSLSAAGPTA